MRFTSFSWRERFVNRMQVAFELRNAGSFMHRSFIFLLPSRGRWKFFFNTAQNSSWSSWSSSGLEIGVAAAGGRRFAFIVFHPLLPSLHRKGKGRGFFGKIQRSLLSELKYNETRGGLSQLKYRTGKLNGEGRRQWRKANAYLTATFVLSVLSKKFTLAVLSCHVQETKTNSNIRQNFFPCFFQIPCKKLPWKKLQELIREYV